MKGGVIKTFQRPRCDNDDDILLSDLSFSDNPGFAARRVVVRGSQWLIIPSPVSPSAPVTIIKSALQETMVSVLSRRPDCLISALYSRLIARIARSSDQFIPRVPRLRVDIFTGSEPSSDLGQHRMLVTKMYPGHDATLCHQLKSAHLHRATSLCCQLGRKVLAENWRGGWSED